MGQSSASPFMNIRDGTERRVSFSTRDELGDKIDKLIVAMSRLAAKDNLENRPFKPQIYKSRGQNMPFNWENFQNRPSNKNRGQNTSSRPRQNYRDNSSQGNFRGSGRQNSRGGYRNDRHNDYKEAETYQEKGYLQEIIIVARIEVQVTVDPDQAPELIQTEIG